MSGDDATDVSGVPGSEVKVMLENEPRCSEGSTMPISLNDELAVWPDDRRPDLDERAGRTIPESRTTRPALAMRVVDVEYTVCFPEFFLRGREKKTTGSGNDMQGACPDQENDVGPRPPFISLI